MSICFGLFNVVVLLLIVQVKVGCSRAGTNPNVCGVWIIRFPAMTGVVDWEVEGDLEHIILLAGSLMPVAIIGTDVADVTLIFLLTIETKVGCLINADDDDVDVKRQTGEIVVVDDDVPFTGEVMIWKVGETTVATGPPTPADTVVAAIFVGVNILGRKLFIIR